MLDAVAPVFRCCLGFLFLCSATSKFVDGDSFRRAVAGYSTVPATLVRPVASTVRLAEATLGAALLLGVEPSLVSLIAGGVLLVFAGAVSWELAHGRSIECGCFGAGSGRISWRMSVRNTLVAAASLATAVGTAWDGAILSTIRSQRSFAGLLTAAALVASYALIKQCLSLLPEAIHSRAVRSGHTSS